MMTLRTFPMLHDLSDSLFADRFNRIDRLFSQLTGSTPLPSTPSYNIR
ncbi:heat-shock protein, partial [Klebsiella pneumoniae]|nr:heat-shock protein [Klebsiella pneumoniae]